MCLCEYHWNDQVCNIIHRGKADGALNASYDKLGRFPRKTTADYAGNVELQVFGTKIIISLVKMLYTLRWNSRGITRRFPPETVAIRILLEHTSCIER